MEQALLFMGGMVAVPVGTNDICNHIEHEVDALVVVIRPHTLYGVGQWYRQFTQFNDKEVHAYLELAETEQKKKMESQG